MENLHEVGLSNISSNFPINWISPETDRVLRLYIEESIFCECQYFMKLDIEHIWKISIKVDISLWKWLMREDPAGKVVTIVKMHLLRMLFTHPYLLL